MKEKLMDFIACPECKGDLELKKETIIYDTGFNEEDIEGKEILGYGDAR
jgi:uncharacterized protein YbaR (Trm112 family)